VDHVEVAPDRDALHGQRPEPPGANLVLHGVARDEGHAEAGHDRALDRLGVVELHRRPEGDARLPQRALGGLPRGGALLPDQQRLVRVFTG
jgi:hypothetical protein